MDQLVVGMLYRSMVHIGLSSASCTGEHGGSNPGKGE